MKGFRTLVINSAIAVLPVLDFIVNNGAVISSLTGPQGATIVSAIGLVNVGLRYITDTPVGKKAKGN